jgi:hypothetical protein
MRLRAGPLRAWEGLLLIASAAARAASARAGGGGAVCARAAGRLGQLILSSAWQRRRGAIYEGKVIEFIV